MSGFCAAPKSKNANHMCQKPLAGQQKRTPHGVTYIEREEVSFFAVPQNLAA